MNFEEIIQETYHKVKSINDTGENASYIPELAKVNPNNFGVQISTVDQKSFGLGNCNDKFSIQSIAKVLSFSLAYNIIGSDIWRRVGVEPSGTPFNSLFQLEADNCIPRNPFLNGGAMVIADILLSNLKKPKEDFLEFTRSIANQSHLNYSAKVAASERAVGYRNKALCYFIKSYGNIDNDPDDVLDFYFHLCSIEMTCKELSEMFLFLANDGRSIQNHNSIVSESQSKRINALMQTCGFYDESGEFAFTVGLPGKSGVGGGIIVVHPDQYAMAVWSPKLNKKGNSFRGMKFLEQFTTKTNLSIF